ncbi:hypothetical protein BD769DRAFT_1396101 [Suillus cothurnatus]|nr:hypothetical protein BD769DRAFT_1396101 [Suillus cothurnatus]
MYVPGTADQLVPGSQGLVNTLNEALSISNAIGFPVILKAKAEGGGMCLLVCRNSSDLSECFISARERATVFDNGLGDVVHMGERKCSVQRRHQKVVEEASSPFVTSHPGLRENMCDAVIKLCRTIKYSSAGWIAYNYRRSYLTYCEPGTVEFLVDDESGVFFFLEMNTHIQTCQPGNFLSLTGKGDIACRWMTPRHASFDKGMSTILRHWMQYNNGNRRSSAKYFWKAECYTM